MHSAQRLAHGIELVTEQTPPCKASLAACIQADDQGNMATFIFESAKQARVSEFELRLRPFDSKRLAIPDHPYVASVRMPSSTFQQICRCVSA